MEQVKRIRYMESLLDEIIAGLSVGDTLPLREKVRELAEYYESPLWLADFEADEAGLLPPDLKRGVLSEDAIYNLLADWDKL